MSLALALAVEVVGAVSPPLKVSPTSTTANTGDSSTFTASGGKSPYTYAVSANNSKGFITSGGIHVAGPVGGTDTITVTDAASHTTTATVVVTAPAALRGVWDAQFGVTLNGSTVSALADQSGAGVEPTLQQTTTGDQPTFVASGINGMADINYPGSKGLAGTATLLGTTALTLFAIARTSGSNSGFIWNLQFNAFHYSFQMKTTGGNVEFVMTSNQRAASDASIADGNPHVLVATWSTADNTGRLYVDGVLQAATLTSTSIPAASGDVNAVGTQANGQGVVSSTFVGRIPVVGAYNAKLSAGDLTKLHNFLQKRAGTLSP